MRIGASTRNAHSGPMRIRFAGPEVIAQSQDHSYTSIYDQGCLAQGHVACQMLYVHVTMCILPNVEHFVKSILQDHVVTLTACALQYIATYPCRLVQPMQWCSTNQTIMNNLKTSRLQSACKTDDPCGCFSAICHSYPPR